MKEIDQAYETLGLKRGASLRQVDEAYRDLRDLWDPKRFSDNPRLRAQASDKKNGIEEAYEEIIEHLSRKPGQKTESSSPKPEESVAQRPDTAQPSTNLFEDAFSGRAGNGKRRIPVGAIIFITAIAGLFFIYLALSPNSERTEAIRTAVREEEESELTKLVEQVRGRYTESQDELEPDGEPDQPASIVMKPVPAVPQPPPKQIAAVNAKKDPPASRQKAKAPEPPPEPEPLPEPEETESQPLDKPLLIREEILTKNKEETKPIDEGPPDAHLEVFKALLQGSETANKLVKGQIGTLDFSEWSIIQETTSETWIDLVATWTSGQEVHFFWSVNPVNGVVRPLNQAARNLESSMESP
jgi:curved DNA-binding protein CbpA